MPTLRTNRRRINLPDIVGAGYGTFWRFTGRYRVVKGSRASKKSKTTALNMICRLMQYPEANLLVVRKTYRSLKDSCFADLKWAIKRLCVEPWWDAKESPLELIYKPTGQRILFRGLDDPLKITSITTPVGVLCWLWIEEAYELMHEQAFDTLDESIRGEMPPGLFKQTTLTLNPWNERHWIKRRFFDAPPSPEVLALTTNYLCNEWLDASDLALFESMKARNPRRYQVAGLGNWGVVEGLIYERWREEAFSLEDVRGLPTDCGLDYGYTNDPSAFVALFPDLANRRIYVWDELYKCGLSNRAIFEEISRMGYGKEAITADSAEPKSNDELHGLGLRIRPAQKGPDSINAGIQWIQDFELVVHPRCVNFLTELSNYAWDKDRFGTAQNRPIDDFNHLMDAMRYALEKHIVPRNAGKVFVRR